MLMGWFAQALPSQGKQAYIQELMLYTAQPVDKQLGGGFLVAIHTTAIYLDGFVLDFS